MENAVLMRMMRLIAALAVASPLVAAGDAEQMVHQRGRKFSLEAVTLALGEQVLFLNDDTVPHNIMSASRHNEFDLGSQMPGTATPVSFNVAGDVIVACAIHPRMHMTIHVAE
jgi:plastocyanin